MTGETPNPETLDLIAVLDGRGYPKDTVTVYFNEDVAYAIHAANAELSRLAALQDHDAYKALDAKLTSLVEEVSSQGYTFHLTGTPRKVRKDILKEVEAKFPKAAERDFLGRPAHPDVEADEYLSARIWQTHIEKIVAPDGAEIVAPDLETIQHLRDTAPDHALKALALKIDGDGRDNKGLAGSASDGFEIAARSSDFLSEP